MIMHEEKIALVRQQIAAVRAAAEKREIRDIYVAACGGSLATLYPVKYILERETDAVTVSAVNAAEFYNDPPCRLGEHALVILNSQSGTTAETVAAARLARERGALTAAFTTAPGSVMEQTVDCPIYYYDDPVNPYPLLLSIFPEVYQLTYALLDLLNGTDRLPVMETAMEELETVCKRAVAQFAPQAREFARKHRTEPGIYTVSAGLDRGVRVAPFFTPPRRGAVPWRLRGHRTGDAGGGVPGPGQVPAGGGAGGQVPPADHRQADGAGCRGTGSYRHPGGAARCDSAPGAPCGGVGLLPAAVLSHRTSHELPPLYGRDEILSGAER